MIPFSSLLSGLCLVACHAGTVLGDPSGQTPDENSAEDSATYPFDDYPSISEPRKGADKDVELRILPLGASIMGGLGSSGHSGLRKWLRMALRHDGWEVNMVGSMQAGEDMKDNDHEGISGAVLTEIQTHLEGCLPYKPNVVIINGGSTNANEDKDIDQSYQQMEDILNDIWGYDDMSDTCIILSTLIPTDYEQGIVNRIAINKAYRKLVQDKKSSKCIYLADMEPSNSSSDFLNIDGPYWFDDPKIHPNNEGYRQMGYVFYASLRRALDAGKVKEAAAMEIDAGYSYCSSKGYIYWPILAVILAALFSF